MRPHPIRIVFCINNFVYGGAQYQLVRQLQRYDTSRFEFHLITLFEHDKETVYHLLPDHVKVHRLSFSGFLSLTRWFQLFQTVRAIKPHVVVSSLYFSNTVMRLLKLLLRYPIVTREHNMYLNKRWYHQVVDRMLAPLSRTIVTVSEEVADFTSTQEHIARSRFTVIENGIDLDEIAAARNAVDTLSVRTELGLRSTDKVLLAVGRLVRQKRFALLIEGCAAFLNKHPTWQLVIVGGGGQENLLRSVAQQSGVSERIHLQGEQANVHQYYASADCLVSTSMMEGMSNTHLEALAHGVPIVTTPTGGTGAIIKEGETGFMIHDATPAGICDALQRYVSADPAQLHAACRAHAKQFDITNTVARYEQLFLHYARD